MSTRSIQNHLIAARGRVHDLTRDLEPAQLLGPKLPLVNPPLWELGHLAWFQERWCLRPRGDGDLADSILPGADAMYDSASVPHSARWTLPLPPLPGTHRYLTNVLGLVLERLDREPENASLAYFAELSACHEDMHAEAFHYTRQTLGYPAPTLAREDRTAAAPRAEVATGGDVAVPGGTFMLGAYPECGFVFDNEKWAHEVRLEPFAIARTPVTVAEFERFVGEGGYRHRSFWSQEGWLWLQEAHALAPRYWRRQGDRWVERRFDRLVRLAPDAPVANVNWYEAEAYCRYAKRRLPTEAEWECAAANIGASCAKALYPWGDTPIDTARANLEGAEVASVHAYAEGDSPAGCRQMLGNVWEWTAATFDPYPGFVRDPYKEYSEPWFGTHKVLRGGSFATPTRLIRTTWRNFYLPHRGDPFAGFRTCALD